MTRTLAGEGIEMFLAEKTVKNFVSNLLATLGMSRRTEAAALAARNEGTTINLANLATAPFA